MAIIVSKVFFSSPWFWRLLFNVHGVSKASKGHKGHSPCLPVVVYNINRQYQSPEGSKKQEVQRKVCDGLTSAKVDVPNKNLELIFGLFLVFGSRSAFTMIIFI